MTVETPEQRRTREQRRVLFDDVAGLYDATRQGYPAEVAGTVTEIAVSEGDVVTEGDLLAEIEPD